MLRGKERLRLSWTHLKSGQVGIDKKVGGLSGWSCVTIHFGELIKIDSDFTSVEEIILEMYSLECGRCGPKLKFSSPNFIMNLNTSNRKRYSPLLRI